LRGTDGGLAGRAGRTPASGTAAAKAGSIGAIPADFVCAALNEVLRPQDIVVNEAIRNAPAVLRQMERTLPGTYISLGGGGLGFSGGAALGAKLARPDSRVLQIVGDGGFHFSNPTAVYAVAQQYGLPVFTVVLDNGGWQAVKEAVLRVYPDGSAASTDQFQARLGGERRDFAQVGAAFGAHAETVEDPQQLRAAIQRCVAANDAGRAAVLCVRVTGL
jgi:acetolactate synthase-1/2/3 large subunit